MTPAVTPAQAARVFARIGFLSFGGPAAQIALMHRELVETRAWLSEATFLRALSFCMLLPGPEAMQLATYAGWRLHGVRGGLVAGLLFVIPGAVVVAALAALYLTLGDVPLVAALFYGVKAAVVAIVLEALVKVARRALHGPAHWAIAALSFVAIFALGLPFPAIVLLAGLWGYLTARAGDPVPAPVPARPADTLRTIAVWTALWLAPVALAWVLGAQFLAEVGAFFSRLAVLTFGGAYAVLAWMAQTVVQDQGWLSTAEMMDGLGLAETTPGPLILVTEFVAIVAGAHAGGAGMAVAAGAMALWVTFTPCFLWIFAGAPWLDRIAGRPRLEAALRAITAAVVGVILNLSLWFATHLFFREVGMARIGPLRLVAPSLQSLDPVAVLLAAGAAILILRLHWPLVPVLAASAAAGVLAAALAG